MTRLLVFRCSTIILTLLVYGNRSPAISSSDKATRAVEAFSLTDVELQEGPFKNASQLNEESLLNYEPDRLLARFRIQAGLEPRAEPYGG